MADSAAPAVRGTCCALALLALLAALGSVSSAQPPDTRPPDDPLDPRAVLLRVLQEPEFQRHPAAAALDGVRQRISRALLDLWTALTGAGAGSRRAATLFAWTVGLLALGALAWWLFGAIRDAEARHPLGLAPPASRRRSARVWAAEALRAHEAGDLREAARCAYRAALARLEEEGAWRQDEARTPREYLRLLPAAHARRPLLASMTPRFERAWYGAAVSAADAHALLEHLQELGCLPVESVA